LLARLEKDDIAAIEAAIANDPLASGWYQGAEPLDRPRILLSLGMHFQVGRTGELTGLPTVQPPADIHAMARGPLAAAGGLYEADLVADALTSIGKSLEGKRAALDFGSSSGRVLRVLGTAYPQVAWHGCDPNGPAIEWAQANLPAAAFAVSRDDPPLPYGDGAFDLVYAISIWSHLEPMLGVAWLDEMHRVLQPGGHLLLTAHGGATVEHDIRHGLRTEMQGADIQRALLETGCWYHPEFGDEGDWGVVNPRWGTAFFSPEWLLTHALPRWRVSEFAAGRLLYNQDVYVLERA
jgi:SAM-dependent methyltransferase